MSRVSLLVDWREFDHEISRLSSLVASITPLDAMHRKLVAEIMIVRLFLAMENTIKSVSAKLLCGAAYVDATAPQRLVAAGSMESAYELMRRHGRPKEVRLGWSQASDVRENLKFTIAPTDPVFGSLSAAATLLTDMRFVRNHVAHKNEGTRVNFRKVVRKHYGGLKPGVTPGLILLTPSLGPPSLLEQYLLGSRVAIKSLVRA